MAKTYTYYELLKAIRLGNKPAAIEYKGSVYKWNNTLHDYVRKTMSDDLIGYDLACDIGQMCTSERLATDPCIHEVEVENEPTITFKERWFLHNFILISYYKSIAKIKRIGAPNGCYLMFYDNDNEWVESIHIHENCFVNLKLDKIYDIKQLTVYPKDLR